MIKQIYGGLALYEVVINICTACLNVFIQSWFVRLLALRPLLAYCASLG
jgi:hypothetical protein